MNKNFMLLVLALLTAILTSGCAHKSLSPSSLKTIDRPAIVLRMLGEPELSLSEQDADQVPRLRARINAFQMSERLRSALIHHLPNVEPWTDIMPSVEVATALDTLLVQDKAEAPRYELLTQKGSNTVLEIVVFRAGLHFNPKTKKTGFFLDGKARLFHINGSTLWKSPLSMDSTELESFPGLQPRELHHDEYFNALNDFLFRLTEAAGNELSADLPRGTKHETAAGLVGTDLDESSEDDDSSDL